MKRNGFSVTSRLDGDGITLSGERIITAFETARGQPTRISVPSLRQDEWREKDYGKLFQWE
jgi:hypothetical protein